MKSYCTVKNEQLPKQNEHNGHTACIPAPAPSTATPVTVAISSIMATFTTFIAAILWMKWSSTPWWWTTKTTTSLSSHAIWHLYSNSPSTDSSEMRFLMTQHLVMCAKKLQGISWHWCREFHDTGVCSGGYSCGNSQSRILYQQEPKSQPTLEPCYQVNLMILKQKQISNMHNA